MFESGHVCPNEVTVDLPKKTVAEGAALKYNPVIVMHLTGAVRLQRVTCRHSAVTARHVKCPSSTPHLTESPVDRTATVEVPSSNSVLDRSHVVSDYEECRFLGCYTVWLL
jgi:hypothetical protein